METKRYCIRIIILLTIIIALVYVTNLMGQAEQSIADTPQFEVIVRERDVLAELDGVGVLVESFRPEVEKYGFNKQQYTTYIESRLRQYGIKVIPFEELIKKPLPYLYININLIINESSGSAAVHCLVQLKEPVILLRKQNSILTATTWQRGDTANSGLYNLNQVRGTVSDLIDMFINDYITVNPKVQQPK